MGGGACYDVSSGWESVLSHDMGMGEHILTCQVGESVCVRTCQVGGAVCSD
jgi:hypothetical protein